jgi:hypothetical protein
MQNTGRSRSTRAALAGVFAAVAFGVAACSVTGTSGSGAVVSQTRQVQPFSRIEAGYGIGVDVQIGPAASIKVEAQQNLLPIIETAVSGDTLKIRGTKEFQSNSTPRVVVTTPTLDGISLNGGSEGRLDGLANDAFDVELGGGAVLTATGSSGDVSIKGSGGSTADLDALTAKSVTVDLSGGTVAHISASDAVKGGVSGGAHVAVAGDAAVDVSASGGGEVSHG